MFEDRIDVDKLKKDDVLRLKKENKINSPISIIGSYTSMHRVKNPEVAGLLIYNGAMNPKEGKERFDIAKKIFDIKKSRQN